MSRIQDIITEVRDVLSDPSGDRWSDDVLIRQLNRGLKQCNLTIEHIKARSYLRLEQGVAKYDLSEFAQKITRIEYNNVNIPSKSEYELDRINDKWSEETGTEIEYCIFDTQQRGKFKIYPIIDDITKAREATIELEGSATYGGIVDIEFVEGLAQLPIEDLSDPINQYIEVYYIKKPDEVTISTLDADLEFDEVLDQALIYYISGKALRNDLDAQNRSFGAEQLGLYDTYTNELMNQENSNNNSVLDNDMPYRGFI